MATLEISARRVVLAGGFALAVAAAPAVAAFATPSLGPASHVAACPSGEEEDTFTGVCLPHTVPNSPTFNTPAGNPDIPEIAGIPCTGLVQGRGVDREDGHATDRTSVHTGSFPYNSGAL